MSPNEEWNVCQWKHILKGQFVSFDKLQSRDLDKLALVKLGYDGSVLGSSQFLLLPQLPQKMTLTLKVTQNLLENNHLDLLVKIRDTLCRCLILGRR